MHQRGESQGAVSGTSSYHNLGSSRSVSCDLLIKDKFLPVQGIKDWSCSIVGIHGVDCVGKGLSRKHFLSEERSWSILLPTTEGRVKLYRSPGCPE